MAGIAAQIGYKRRFGQYGSKPAMTAEKTLGRQFDVACPDTVWVTDITCIKTLEGWLYLAVVTDLFSRCVVGWSMQSRITADLALQAKVKVDDPFRPRPAVHQPGVAIVSATARSGCQYEPTRELP